MPASKGKRRGTTPKPIPQTNGPKVYSYIRFSSPEQALGDSERRQLEKARDYAARRNLPFDEMMRDPGLSAFSGAHVAKGALGRFLATVEQGKVPKGSVLVIEKLNRLSRQDIFAAFDTVKALISNGIEIQTLSPEATYTSESLNQGGQIYMLVGQLQEAHQSSKDKSEWGSDNWNEKRRKARDEGHILTRMHPQWLTIKDGVFKPIPEAKKTLQMMFRLKEKGLGLWAITKQLNEKAPWQPPKKKKKRGNEGETVEGWIVSYVRKCLESRAVIGEFQPHRKINEDGRRVRKPVGDVILDYYPKVVDAELFHSVQQMLNETKGQSKGGRTGKATNVFQHLVKCGYCGGPMHLRNDGEGRLYLFCSDGKANKQTSTCRDRKTPAIRYEECLAAFLAVLSSKTLAAIIPNEDEQSELADNLRLRIQRKRASLADFDERISNLNEQIETTKDAKRRAHYENRVIELEREKATLEKQAADAQRELHQAESGKRTVEELHSTIETLRGKLDKSPEARQQMNAHLRTLVDRIEIFSDGYAAPFAHAPIYQVKDENRNPNDEELAAATFLNEDRFGTELTDVLKVVRKHVGVKASKEDSMLHKAFVDWAMAKRATKDGRFFRAYFASRMTPAITMELRSRFPDVEDEFADECAKRKARWIIDIAPEGSVGGHLRTSMYVRLCEQFEKAFGVRPPKLIQLQAIDEIMPMKQGLY